MIKNALRRVFYYDFTFLLMERHMKRLLIILFWVIVITLLFAITFLAGGHSESEESISHSDLSEQNEQPVEQPINNGEAENSPQQQEMVMNEDGFQMDDFKTQSGKSVKFYAIKHGSLRIAYNDIEIEVDPVTDLDGNKTDYHKLPKADYILITHEHYDHYDKTAIEALEKDGTMIITNENVAKMLGKGEIMKNGDEKSLREDMIIHAVPAYNTTPDHQKFHPKGRDNGFVLTLDGFRVYIGADTEDIPEMADIKDIDVAFLPCNQPYTMTPEQLLKAAGMFQPKVLFPYHYSQTDMRKVTSLFKDSKIDVRIRNYQ